MRTPRSSATLFIREKSRLGGLSIANVSLLCDPGISEKAARWGGGGCMQDQAAPACERLKQFVQADAAEVASVAQRHRREILDSATEVSDSGSPTTHAGVADRLPLLGAVSVTVLVPRPAIRRCSFGAPHAQLRQHGSNFVRPRWAGTAGEKQ